MKLLFKKIFGKKIYAFGCLMALCMPLNACSGQKSASDLSLLGGIVGLASGSQVGSPCPTINPASGIFLADTIVSAPSHTGSGFFQKGRSTNGVCGSGYDGGSLDVFSLNMSGAGAALVLEWSGGRVKNASGIDFVVFENPFRINGNESNVFMDPTIVEVSTDDVNYCGFLPDYLNADETVHSTDPTKWSNFAGISPVLYNQDSNPLDATRVFNPLEGGGDGFDLANLNADDSFAIGCSATLVTNIQTNGFRYLRLISASARTNSDSAAAFPMNAISDGADIDGVIARQLGP